MSCAIIGAVRVLAPPRRRRLLLLQRHNLRQSGGGGGGDRGIRSSCLIDRELATEATLSRRFCRDNGASASYARGGGSRGGQAHSWPSSSLTCRASSSSASARRRNLTTNHPSSETPLQPHHPSNNFSSDSGGSQLHWWRQPPHSSSSGGAHSNSSQYGGGGDGGGSAGSFFWPTLLVRAVVASGLVHLWTEYVSDVTLCEGPSMSPTIQPAGEIIVVDKWNPRILGLKDGDDGSVRADLARKRQVQFEQSRRNKKAEASSRATAMSSPTCCWHEPVLPSVSELEEKQQQQQKKLQFLSFYSTAWMQMRSPVSVGDVLVVQHPSRQGTVCKRVVGLPGDEILLGSGHRGFGGVAGASASSSSLLASFRASPDRSSTSTASTNRRQLVVVPDGHVWLEGDNPSNSSDSRHYGPVPASLIVGRVLFRIWPLRGRAWMLRGRRPVAAQDNYYAPPATVVLPAGYDGQPMLRQDIHDSLL